MRVTLNGYVVADDDAWIYELFGYTVFSPAVVRQAIRDNPDGEELVLEINSGGGSVFAGFEIYSVLRDAVCATVAEVQSLAASAASTLMLGCRKIMLSPVAQVMIHLPSASTEGDRQAHEKSIQLLDSIMESILNGYEVRCGEKCGRKELRNIMQSTEWMPAQKAVKLGLADGILYQEGDAPIAEDVMNCIGGGLRGLVSGLGGLPSAATLRAKYQKQAGGEQPPENNQNPAGGPPAEHTGGWTASAALALEKLRF